ncbi:helix-turn-helix domain-containing protein [Sphingomonas sp. SRS2]|uniref:helix-turn-helix domain-containing protein n=1 Tax=Sphingomonas sp. SRS2 TaxID=133190 RepID=UPI001F1CAC2E|nr:XRE family transcriptional regulator [Sphingomonas sp. SRS2]
MSEKSGIPVSTLSKIEHDRLTLTYDKLQSLAQRLGLRLSELFAETGDEPVQAVTARRSLSDISRSVRVETPNYDYYYLCTELRRKRMVPLLTKIRARSVEQFGELVHHSGEEFLYVLSGKVVVQTEFYDPVTLGPGEALYIDSSMGHAYLAAEGCDEAEVLAVMSSADEDLMESLLEIHDVQKGAKTIAKSTSGARPRGVKRGR